MEVDRYARAEGTIPLAVGVDNPSARLPRVASPSFVNPLRQKRYDGQESTSEGKATLGFGAQSLWD